MNRSLVRLGRAAAVCALLARASLASADDADAGAASPPRLTGFVEAVDPREAGARAVVELELAVTAEGAVREVHVMNGASPELEAAAVAAASAFVFEPAVRSGRPIAARIRYAYVFAERLAPPAPAPVPAPAPGPAPVPAPAPAVSLPPAATQVQAFGATAQVQAPPREVTHHTLGGGELTRVAGTRGDPLRAIELLPGVSRPDVSGGSPILRGANPDDSQVFVEGMPAPLLYHFGALTSFVHSRVLERVDVYPSNFSVRYGRKAGGVIEARLRDPRTDRPHAMLEVGFLDSSVVAEAPLGDKLSALVAARRSNLDAVINSATAGSDLRITSAPVYWDYQSVATYKATDRDRLRLLAYGSKDTFRLSFAHPNEDAPGVRGAVGGSTEFHRVQLGYRHRWASGSEAQTDLTYGRTAMDGVYGTLARQEVVIDNLQARGEWAVVAGPALRVVAGLDLASNHFEGTYRGIPPDTGEGGGARNVSTLREVAIVASQWVHRPGAYLELGFRPVPRLLILPGVRADHDGIVGRLSVDPRLTVRFEASKRTTLKAGVGRYSQSVDERFAVEPIGNPRLGLTHALHAAAGVEQAMGDHVTVSTEAFAKWLDDVISATPDGRAPFFVNGQRGRIFGGELLVRVRPGGRFFGFLAYTLMRSERREDGEGFRLFDRDQPHILNATAAYRLGRGWEVGASFRLTSGTPYTPVVDSTYEATSDTYSPRLGRAMSARNAAFTRVDVRVQKTWTFARWSFAVFLDVQNALNSPNREYSTYSYDYTRRDAARGLPILPLLGLRGEL